MTFSPEKLNPKQNASETEKRKDREPVKHCRYLQPHPKISHKTTHTHKTDAAKDTARSERAERTIERAKSKQARARVATQRAANLFVYLLLRRNDEAMETNNQN